jgi:hypothetical protein
MWVPLDDEHTMIWSMAWNPFTPIPSEERETMIELLTPCEFLPTTSDALGSWRLAANKGNDYRIDYDAQETRRFSGIPHILLQDWAVTETAGVIQDRTKEHLGTTDVMIAKLRRRFINLANALRQQGEVPRGVDCPEVYQVRSASIVLPKDANWIEAASDLVKAFTDIPVSAEVPFVEVRAE